MCTRYNIVALLLTKFFLKESDFDEWVKHHLSLGFSHIHVFDNGTVFDLEAACKKYGDSVSYEKVEGHVCQYTLYEKHIKGCDAEYVMPIDDDEYLSLGPFESIGELMEHFGKPDCFGFRWKYMFPKHFGRVRNVPVLRYCTEQNPQAARFFCTGGDRSIKCIVRVSDFVRYKDACESITQNHIPVTKRNEGALLCDGSRTLVHKVSDCGDEPVRLLHCPYKGYGEFINTRCSSRPSVARTELQIRRGHENFIKWLEKNYERQTA